MLEGTVLKGYSGFYYVKYNQQIYECSLRGKNRIKKIKFLPGDKVTFEPISQEKGVIEDLLPRKNELIRPPITNVEQVIIVSSLVNPEPDLWLLDRLTILALWNDIKPILCLNKADLSSQEKIANLKKIYEQAKFKVLVTSAKKNLGIDDLKGVLKDQISVVAGASGVGKSSILNAIQPDLRLQIGEVSLKLKRGKHTTRHVELIPLHFGGLVADTPGFSSLNLPEDIMREQLSFLFPDFDQYRNNCKFSTCLHKEEPECSVREAVQKGKLAQNRYNNYLAFLEEVIKQERSY